MSEPKKQTGILWKLAPEEKAALREVCEYAEMAADDFGEVTHERIRPLTVQLLGEEE